MTTTSENESSKQRVPIKFNKETKMLPIEEASRLAQLGMKYETLSKELEALKALARLENKGVKAYLEGLLHEKQAERREELIAECGGNEQVADRLLRLENEDFNLEVLGFDELKESFPEIKSLEALPEKVVMASSLKGSLLLDEYLRYLLAEKLRLKELERNRRNAEMGSIGSQLNKSGAENIETLEFLRGLWK